eukprot:9664916-Karenia_brevis.AAC.1
MAFQPHSQECRRRFEEILREEAKVKNQKARTEEFEERVKERRKRRERKKRRTGKKRIKDLGLVRKVGTQEDPAAVEKVGKEMRKHSMKIKMA